MSSSATIRETLTAIATERGYTNYLQRIPQPKQFTLRIGFLGEFSAGKSSLLNALIGKDLLPAMSQPTTGSITRIVVTDEYTEPRYGKLGDDGDIEFFGRAGFDEVATGKQPGEAILFIPPNGNLKSGYYFIDTPGLASVHENHTDITFGYLAQLDAAVICIDIANGGLNKSISSFLGREEIAFLARHFVFAITHTDQAPASQATKVRQEVLRQIKELLPASSQNDLERRVVLTSAKNALEDQVEKSGILELRNTFSSVFYDREEDLVESREIKLLRESAVELHDALLQERENISLETSEISVQLQEQKDALSRLESSIQDTRKQLRSAEDRIESQALEIALGSVSSIKNASSDEEVNAHVQSMVEQITGRATSIVSSFGENIIIPTAYHNTSGITEQFKRISKNVEVGKFVATAVAVAAIGPAAGLKNVGEAAAGGAVKAVAKRAATTTVTTTSKKRVFAQTLGQLLENLNPLNLAGDLVGEYFKGRVAESELRNMAKNIAADITNHVRYFIESDIFQPIRAKIEGVEDAMNALRRERQQQQQDVGALKRDLEKKMRMVKEITKG